MSVSDNVRHGTSVPCFFIGMVKSPFKKLIDSPQSIVDIVANVKQNEQVTRQDIHDLLHHYKEKDKEKKLKNLKSFMEKVPPELRKKDDLEKIADDLDSYQEDYV